MSSEQEADEQEDPRRKEKPAEPPSSLPAHLANPTPATVNPTSPPPARPDPKASEEPAQSTFAKGRPTYGSGALVPASQLDSAGKAKVDKYFGSRLPPVCRQLGCYVTDDGKYYYCINPHCHKDRKRETKYNRRRRNIVYFFCPKCKSREIQLHLRKNHYECLECAYTWRK